MPHTNNPPDNHIGSDNVRPNGIEISSNQSHFSLNDKDKILFTSMTMISTQKTETMFFIYLAKLQS